MDWFDDSALTLAVFLPLLGAVAVAVLPKERDGLIRGVGVGFTALALLATGATVLLLARHTRAA